MIYPLIGLIAGAFLGAYRARSNGGNRLDMLQWAIVFALILGLLGLFAMIFIDRSYR